MAAMVENRFHGDGYKTRWYDNGRALCDAIKRGHVELKVGDILEMELLDNQSLKAKIYSHWGIVSKVSGDPYECLCLEFLPGSATISPFTVSTTYQAKSSTCISSSDLYSLEKNKIADFPRKIKINNSKDSKTVVLPATEISRRIDDVLSLTEPFHFASNNCEHFVNYIRYDKKESDQVLNTTVLAAAGAVAAKVICVIS
ncbi:phospholipase A and acyltransferase 3-like [Amphiura filiformis]|uniref:phospholipase A and acyltransferase 3-like n=1 Tax=Amphiura filiformis TaxID=82378 RepID=UPI003B2158C6